MSATAKIAKHYQRSISGELLKLNVPEWEMDIYYRKTYSFQDEAKIIELQTQGKVVEALVRSLVVKARDKDGKRIFSDVDEINLMNEADPNVITRVCGVINNASSRPDPKELEKESNPTAN